MELPLLQTKLFIPPPRANLVIRSRLEERLDSAIQANYKLVLLSASAGYGKTTLLAGWMKKFTGQSAWLSLDAEDNDPAHFWRYLMAALASAHAQLGDAFQNFFSSAQIPPTAHLLTFISNAIASLPIHPRLILVLDDYHLITNQEIHTYMASLLEHLPPQILLVLATRQDPPLPVARIRAKGQLVEIRAQDLQFTGDEARALVQSIAQVDLQTDEIKTLETKTEGWAVGLQMAALSLSTRDHPADFLNHFSGRHGFILDYLSEEVFTSLSDHVQQFLLRTAIVDQMNAGLCTALMQGAPAVQSDQTSVVMDAEASAQLMLETLERANLFLIPLDSSQQWYRYHHLFADLLRARLKQTHPTEIPLLHHLASEWYQQNGYYSLAVQHALASSDTNLASRLVLEYWKPMAWRGEINTVLTWFEALPPLLIRNNVLLGAAYAWTLNLIGRFQQMDQALDEVEQNLSEQAPPGKAKDWLAARLSIGPLRVSRAIRHENYTDARRYAEQALELAPEEEVQERGVAFFSLGTANRALGDFLTAKQAFADAIPLLRKSGNQTAVSASAYALVNLWLLEGELPAADRIATEALEWIDITNPPPAAAQTFTALGEVRYLENRLDEAAQWLDRAYGLSSRSGYLEGIHCSAIALARLHAAQGNLGRAAAILEEAARYIRGMHGPLSGIEIAAALARLQASAGDLQPAGDWADTFLRQPPALAVIPMETAILSAARVRMAQGRSEEALQLVERVCNQAESGQRTTTLVEALICKAIILQSKQDAKAWEPLQKAIDQAVPVHLARPFLDEATTINALLTTCLCNCRGNNRACTFIQYLLDQSLPTAEELEPHASSNIGSLIEPLSAREVEILKYLCQGWSNQEIADHLFIALPTVKKHTGNIFGKLGVTSRTQAIARAHVLGIV